MAENEDATEGTPRFARDWWKPGDPLPWAKFYWRVWLSDPAIRGLTRDERAGFMDVWSATLGTKTPGVMTEEEVRRWAGYDEKSWREHRDAFAKCFNTKRVRGKWRLEDVFDTWKASMKVAKTFQKRARKGVEARRRKSSGDNAVTTRGQPQVRLDVDIDVQSTEKSEFKNTAVPDRQSVDAGRGGRSSPLPDDTTAGVPALLERALGASSAHGTNGTEPKAGGGS